MFISYDLFMDEPFVVGDTYLVSWDGEEYECQARRNLENGNAYIGTINYFDGESPTNDDESAKYTPFAMMMQEVNNAPKSGGDSSGDGVTYTLIMLTPDTAESHTVSIRHVSVEKRVLDEQLLPVLYYGEEQLSILDLLIYMAQNDMGITLTREPVVNSVSDEPVSKR